MCICFLGKFREMIYKVWAYGLWFLLWYFNDKYSSSIYSFDYKLDENIKCETPHITEEEIAVAFIKVMNILITEKDEIIENIQLIRQTVLDVITFKEGHDKLRSEMKSVVEVI